MTEAERGDDQIRRTDLRFRDSHPGVESLLLTVGDWRTECRLPMAERGSMNMGYRGPTPKPSALARAEGNPGKRRLNDSEPQPRATVPRCPDHLDVQAKKEWKRLVPVLRRMRVLTEADWMTLANLCQTWSTMVKAQEKLTEMGILYKTPSFLPLAVDERFRRFALRIESVEGLVEALLSRFPCVDPAAHTRRCRESGLVFLRTPFSAHDVPPSPGRKTQSHSSACRLSRPRSR